jgi:protein gp37
VAARFSGPGQPYEGLAEMKEVVQPHRKEWNANWRGKEPRWTGEVRFIRELLDQPLHWRRPRKIFVNSMSDLFHEKVPQEWIAQIFNVMWRCPQHTFQILTKRAERMRDVMADLTAHSTMFMGKPLLNVWLGVSVEDQPTADERIQVLLTTPAAVRWVSYEPALGPVAFNLGWFPVTHCSMCKAAGLDWIVGGGESGPGARPAHPDWFRAVRDQCQAGGVPFFFKQWGEWLPQNQFGFFQRDEAERRYRGVRVNDMLCLRVGKKKAGRLLDGREHNERPKL